MNLDEPVHVHHWCGKAERHRPHGDCNGFGYDAGPGCGGCASCRNCAECRRPKGVF